MFLWWVMSLCNLLLAPRQAFFIRDIGKHGSHTYPLGASGCPAPVALSRGHLTECLTAVPR
jgi:hypothetical protein